MSWARHGKDSDVYVYGDGSVATVCCCACRLHPTGLSGGRDYDSTYPETYGQALDHFLRHVAAGHKVPKRVFERLVEDSVRDAKRGRV